MLDKEHAALKIQNEHVGEEFKNTKEDFESVSEKLKISNKVRNEKEEMLNDKMKQLHLMGE